MFFNFDEDYILENEVARLVPLASEHYEKLLPFSLNEPDLWEYSLVQAIGEKGLKKYINIALEGRKAENSYPFLVFDKRTKHYAGSTRFCAIELTQNTAQLGFTWYGKDFQRTGLNQNCKFLMLKFAFEKMKFDRIEFRADNKNTKSIAAMKKIGCKEEGILRKNNFKSDGSRRDSILKEEWFTEVKKILEKKISR
jgi:N-acetyltransferase